MIARQERRGAPKRRLFAALGCRNITTPIYVVDRDQIHGTRSKAWRWTVAAALLASLTPRRRRRDQIQIKRRNKRARGGITRLLHL